MTAWVQLYVLMTEAKASRERNEKTLLSECQETVSPSPPVSVIRSWKSENWRLRCFPRSLQHWVVSLKRHSIDQAPFQGLSHSAVLKSNSCLRHPGFLLPSSVILLVDNPLSMLLLPQAFPTTQHLTNGRGTLLPALLNVRCLLENPGAWCIQGTHCFQNEHWGCRESASLSYFKITN